jgi:uncharacterized protein involved in exopolysaccharide biosynthesis
MVRKYTMQDNVESLFSTRDFWNVIFRHKFSIALICLFTVATVFVGLCVWPESYEAEAALLVKLGRENLSDPTVSPTGHQVLTMGVRREDIRSEIELLDNRYLAEKVINALGTSFLFPEPTEATTQFAHIKNELRQAVGRAKNFATDILDELDLTERLSDHERAVLAVRNSLSVQNVRNSDVIEVRFRWADPAVAEKVLQTLLDLYIEHHWQAHQASGSYDFFQRQVEIMRGRLEESEEELRLLEESKGIVSYEQQRSALLAQRDSFTALVKETESDIAGTKRRIEELNNQISSHLEKMSTGVNQIVTEARRDLLLQEVKLQALEGTKKSLQKHIASYQADLDKLSAQQLKLKRLARQVAIDERDYELYQKKLEEARISEAQGMNRIVNIRVIEPPTVSYQLAGPKKVSLLALAFILGPIVAVGFALAREYMDHSIKTGEDVRQYLDLPLLTSVPETNRWKRWKNMKL